MSRVLPWGRFALVLPFALVVACSGGTPADAGGSSPTWWVEAQKAPGSKALYGWGSVVPSGPPLIQLLFLIDQPTLTCTDVQHASRTGQWYLSVSLDPADGGTFTVGGDAPAAGLAPVTILQALDTSWSALAVSGSLNLSTFPKDPSDTTTPVAGHLTALFPDAPISTIDCQGGALGLPDGGVVPMPGVCDCQYVDGGTFTCALPASLESLPSCCPGDGGVTIALNHQLSFDFTASGCP